jgi:hypothetical protein
MRGVPFIVSAERCSSQRESGLVVWLLSRVSSRVYGVTVYVVVPVSGVVVDSESRRVNGRQIDCFLSVVGNATRSAKGDFEQLSNGRPNAAIHHRLTFMFLQH